MFTKSLQKAFEAGQLYAVQNSHNTVLPEHILLLLLSEDSVKKMFKEANVTDSTINAALGAIKNYLMTIPTSSYYSQIAPHSSINTLINLSAQYARGFQKNTIEGVHFLLAYFHEDDSSQAKKILEMFKITKDLILETLSDMGETLYQEVEDEKDESAKNDGKKSYGKMDYLVNLSEKMKENPKLDPVIGRSSEIDRLVHVLSRKKKNNPLLVGEPGTGKTSIAEGLAKKILDGDVHESLKGAEVFSLDIGAMTAGTKFRGDFEDRLKKVIKRMKETPNSILFIDEIHTLIGAGGSGNGNLDAANMLKPGLANGEIRCIGATTYKEYRNVFEKDAALARRFQKIDIVEPSISDTVVILNGLKENYEKHHKVNYSEEALKLAVELSVKHINDRFLPDKAIDVMDEAGTLVKLRGTGSVGIKEIEKVIAKMARIPEKELVLSEKDRLKNLRNQLKSQVYGQDHVVDKLVNIVQLSKSGLRKPTKPIGSFLFCGPTGVGKTELAKQLATSLSIPFFRFDMSEYMEKHNVSKLIGAPPGYVGYDQEGALTGAVIKNPHSVLLLDEVEKAHPDVLNIMLQVLDDGSLTDGNGKKADFRNSIIILTSNVGSTEMTKKSISMISDGITYCKPLDAIEKTFSPEFRNRLDSILWFNSLDKKIVMDILNKNLAQLDLMLVEKGITIDLSDSAKEFLSEKGFLPSMGARPMERAVEEYLKIPLTEEILFGKLMDGGKVFVNTNEEKNQLVFDYKDSRKKRSKVVSEKESGE